MEIRVLVHVRVARWRNMCQLKNIKAHGDARNVGHSNMHYMPIHTKLRVNMCMIRISKLRVNQLLFRDVILR